MRDKSLRDKSGFTLIELVVVIAILAVLATIAIPVVSHTINGAVMSGAQADANTLESTLSLAKAAVDTDDDSIYGSLVNRSTFTVGDVVKHQNMENICEPRVYNGRQFVFVWNCSNGGVALMYTDDSTDVETGNTLTNYIIIAETSTTLVANLPIT